MGTKGYPAEFRRRVIELVEGGRKVADAAADLGISDQTIYSWRHQDRIDRGVDDGLSTQERGELASTMRRIAQLGAELAIQCCATELLKEEVPDPKGGSRPSR